MKKNPVGLMTQLDAAIDEHSVNMELNGPATDVAISALRRTIGDVPEDLLAILKAHDGQSLFAEASFYYRRLGSCEDIAKVYRSELDCSRELMCGSDPTDAVQTDVSWRPEWIPIAWLEDSIYFIDNAPGPRGVKGQIVSNSVESELPMHVVATDLSHWLERLTAFVLNGKFDLSDGLTVDYMPGLRASELRHS